MLGLGLSLQKGVSAFNAGRAIVSSYIRRVISDGGVLQNTACDAAAINELNQDRLLGPASWVLVPDGIKEDVVYAQKPSTGLGDITFTRASDATYTDSTGVVRRSPYNLIRFSEMFTDAAWGKNAVGINTAIGTSGIQANVATAPNGTLTADRVNFNLQSDPDIGLNQFYPDAFAGQSFTCSVYVKGEGSNIGKQIKLRLKRNSGGLAVSVDATITLTSDWVRITPAALTLVASNTGLQYIISSNDATNALIWGTQVVEGTSALDYFPTTNRQDVPRIDFRNADGTLSSCGRLLLEPQRTNSIRNSSMVGAVAGSPGTTPTNWGITNAGLNQTVVGVGTESGLPYIDLRFNGTANFTTGQISFETAGQIVAATGQVWTNSVYFKIVSQPNPALSYALSMREGDAAGVFITSGESTFTPNTTLSRYSFVRTLTGALTTRVAPRVNFNLTNGATYDFTIRIAAPQMELGAYATTWVPTTTAAVTRIADTASKTGVSSLIGQTQGTLFCEVNIRANKDSVRALQVSDGTLNNRIQLAFNANNFTPAIVTGGVSQASFTVPFTAGNNKIAIAYANNDIVIYVNGSQLGTDNSATIPACSLLDVGQSIGGTNTLGDTIAQAALFQTRLTNDQLEVLTSEGYGNYALLAQSLNYVLQ